MIAKPLLANQREDDMEYWVDVAGEDCEEAIKHLKVMSLFFVNGVEIRDTQEGKDIGHITCNRGTLHLDPVWS